MPKRKEGAAGATPGPNDRPVAEPAGGPRGLVEARCGFAEKARVEATAAAARLVEAKHDYEVRAAAAVGDQLAIDPGTTQASKDAAHRSFRAAVAGARSRGQVEAAASAWLAAINQINSDGRISRARITREREAVEALLAEVARLAEIAEASAAMAADATQACQAARAALAAEADATADAADAAGAPGAAQVGPASGPLSRPPAALPPDESRSPTDWLVIDIRSPEP